MDHLQAGVQFPFAVFLKFPAFFEPCEKAFNDPSFGHDGKGVKLVSFGDLHICAQFVLYGFGKWFARVAAAHQHAADVLQVAGAALDAGDLLARVVALMARCIGVLHALRVNDQQAGRGASPLFGTVLAN
jgi:hypothetical protein